MFESDAIAEYIEELSGERLLSEDPVERAQDRAWSYLASKNYLVQCSTQRSKDLDMLNEREAKFRKALSKIEQRLPDTPYFRGIRPGMVDISWLPVLHRAAIIERETGYDFLANLLKTKAWQRQMLDSGLPDKTVSSDFEEKFISFYLSDETYLGQKRVNRETAAAVHS